MYRHLLLFAALLLGTLSTDAQPTGWATIDGGTDGGRGENAIVVTTYQELVHALGKRDSTYRTIYVKGHIDFPGMLRVKDVSNKSLIGLPGSALVNDRYTLDKDSTGILRLDRCKNMILQNITFLGPGAFDRDANDNLCVSQSSHIWVDHCDFQDGMDGNFDCNSGSDLITVSYCRFRYLKAPWPKLADDTNDDHNSDHRFSSLWGSSDREGMISGGRLRTTFYRCWWDDGCRARMPFVRFGKMHMLNCLYSSNVAKVYIQARYRSNVFVEACAFVNKPRDLKLFEKPSSSKPTFQDYNLRFCNCLGADDLEQRHGQEPYFEPPYPYEAGPASEVETVVRQSAGATLSIAEPSL
ncbi:MAG: chromophore lyase [Prevotella sp.]|nr:chromophore lyase [Prevotella sp.]